MRLEFPDLNGGTVQGLNDAGVENFQGAIDTYISRECGQNTADAARSGATPARLEFDRSEVEPREIPGFDELRISVKACLAKWGDKPKELEFFRHAVDLANQKQVSLLKISDYGTTGLTGGDSDEKGRWFALVKSQGVSNKSDTAGGSFGIGKSSPFAASRFRTVFYGTRTESGAVALQGVSRLATHKNAKGRLTQGVGFIGSKDPHGGEGGEPVFRAIRNESQIPMHFRRTEVGTDIWVIGYRSGPEWQTDLVRSILTNFWPAISKGLIQFRVGEQQITAENLPDLIASHTGFEDFEAHHYFGSIKSQPIKKKLKHVGECELFLTTASPDLPRKICMVRKTGMRIYDYQPKACRVPFSGLFMCTDPIGNKLLRDLEPPKHDAWDPKRVEASKGKEALDEIKLWIRDEVKKLNPLTSGSSFNENELAKYVPDIDAEIIPQEDHGTSDEESLEPKPSEELIDVKPMVAQPIIPYQKGVGRGGGTQSTKKSSRKGSTGGGSGKSSGGPPRPPRILARSFPAGTSEYQLILRSEKDFSGNVRLFAVGEDGQHESVVVKAASLGSSKGKLLAVKQNQIQGLKFAENEGIRIVVAIQELGRRSLAVVADE